MLMIVCAATEVAIAGSSEKQAGLVQQSITGVQRSGCDRMSWSRTGDGPAGQMGGRKEGSTEEDVESRSIVSRKASGKSKANDTRGSHSDERYGHGQVLKRNQRGSTYLKTRDIFNRTRVKYDYIVPSPVSLVKLQVAFPEGN